MSFGTKKIGVVQTKQKTSFVKLADGRVVKEATYQRLVDQAKREGQDPPKLRGSEPTSEN